MHSVFHYDKPLCLYNYKVISSSVLDLLKGTKLLASCVWVGDIFIFVKLNHQVSPSCYTDVWPRATVVAVDQHTQIDHARVTVQPR